MKLKIIVHKYIPLVLNGIIIHQMLILSIRVIIFPLCQHERVLFISVESGTGKFSKYPQSFESRVESQEITFFCENKKMYSQEERPTFMTFVFQAVNNGFFFFFYLSTHLQLSVFQLPLLTFPSYIYINIPKIGTKILHMTYCVGIQQIPFY